LRRQKTRSLVEILHPLGSHYAHICARVPFFSLPATTHAQIDFDDDLRESIEFWIKVNLQTQVDIELHHQYVVVKPNENDIGSPQCPWKITYDGSAVAFYHSSSYSFGMLEWLFKHMLRVFREYTNVTCNGSIRFVGPRSLTDPLPPEWTAYSPSVKGWRLNM
jgi:hypothetical protein